MNIDKFKQQHVDILTQIAALRTQSQNGIAENAAGIARAIVTMSSTIKLHLAVEDSALYPALQQSNNARLAKMGKQFQDDMQSIANSYLDFARRWNTASRVEQDPEGFRADANKVLKVLHLRMQRENRDFYPLIEAA